MIDESLIEDLKNGLFCVWQHIKAHKSFVKRIQLGSLK